MIFSSRYGIPMLGSCTVVLHMIIQSHLLPGLQMERCLQLVHLTRSDFVIEVG